MSEPTLPDIPGYEVQAELGRGGMGVVYRVRDRADGTVRALKLLLRGRGASFAELVRFRIEAEALACLNHPNIVKIRAVGWYAGCPYFALDLAARGSLKHAVRNGPLTPRSAAALVRTAALAVQHAHDRGMLHRDLKPANILVAEDGTPRVSDFGLVKFADPLRKVSSEYATFSVSALDSELSNLARELGAQYAPADGPDDADDDVVARTAWKQCADRTGVFGDEAKLKDVRSFLAEARRQPPNPPPFGPDGLTRTGAAMGSPCYMAPEQFIGDARQVGPRTDIYGLGGVLYELLTGQPPYRPTDGLFGRLAGAAPPPSPRRVVPEVAGDVEAICVKCLERKPEDRYPSAAAMAEDLARFLDGYTPAAAEWPGPARVAPPAAPAGGPSGAGQMAAAPPPGQATTRSWWPFRRDRSGPGPGPT